MSWTLYALFGVLAGLVARSLTTGRQPYGLLWTLLLGIGGALVGGLVTNALAGTPLADPAPVVFLGAAAGAVASLVVYLAVRHSRAPSEPVRDPPREA